MDGWNALAKSNPVLGFVDEVLRGIGQVMFQNSPVTGLFFLAGLFVGGVRFGLYALLATAVATITAHLFGIDASAIGAGLYGFNGTLVGVALAFYLADAAFLPLYVVLASVVVTFVTAATANVLGTWQTPTLTAPFVVTTWFFTLGIYGLGQVRGGPASQAPGLPAVPADAARAALDASDLWTGGLKGVSEVFFQNGVLIGVLFLLGILAASRIDCVMAIVGSLIGLGTGWLLGADRDSLTLGLMGYNAVLTMMALGGLFFVLSRHGVALAAIATAASAVVSVALSTVSAPFGGHIFTAPFVVVTWFFILAKPFLHNVVAVPPAQATSPEGNINLYRLKGHWWERE